MKLFLLLASICFVFASSEVAQEMAESKRVITGENVQECCTKEPSIRYNPSVLYNAVTIIDGSGSVKNTDDEPDFKREVKFVHDMVFGTGDNCVGSARCNSPVQDGEVDEDVDGLEMNEGSAGVRMGLIQFSSDVQVERSITGTTSEYENIRDSVTQMTGTTHITTALNLAETMLEEYVGQYPTRDAPVGRNRIILLTDGAPSGTPESSDEAKEVARIQTIQRAAELKALGYEIFTIAIGTGADEVTLYQMASSSIEVGITTGTTPETPELVEKLCCETGAVSCDENGNAFDNAGEAVDINCELEEKAFWKVESFDELQRVTLRTIVESMKPEYSTEEEEEPPYFCGATPNDGHVESSCVEDDDSGDESIYFDIMCCDANSGTLGVHAEIMGDIEGVLPVHNEPIMGGGHVNTFKFSAENDFSHNTQVCYTCVSEVVDATGEGSNYFESSEARCIEFSLSFAPEFTEPTPFGLMVDHHGTDVKCDNSGEEFLVSIGQSCENLVKAAFAFQFDCTAPLTKINQNFPESVTVADWCTLECGLCSTCHEIECEVGAECSFELWATDSNAHEEVAIFGSELPSGATFAASECHPVDEIPSEGGFIPGDAADCNTVSRKFSWTPCEGDEGRNYHLHFIPRDNNGACVEGGAYGESHCVDVSVKSPDIEWEVLAQEDHGMAHDGHNGGVVGSWSRVGYVNCPYEICFSAHDHGEKYSVAIFEHDAMEIAPAHHTDQIKHNNHDPRKSQGPEVDIYVGMPMGMHFDETNIASEEGVPAHTRCLQWTPSRGQEAFTYKIHLAASAYNHGDACLGEGEYHTGLSGNPEDTADTRIWESTKILGEYTITIRRCKYCVGVDESMLSIANEWDVDWLQLWGANPLVKNPDNLANYQLINLGVLYDIREADTIDALAERFETTPGLIMSMNPDIEDVDDIDVNQEICISLGICGEVSYHF
jgi:uncharacterized protein YegL